MGGVGIQAVQTGVKGVYQTLSSSTYLTWILWGLKKITNKDKQLLIQLCSDVKLCKVPVRVSDT